MSRFKLVGSNVLTALVTAAVTSAFWLIAFNNDGPGDGRVEASGDSVTLGRRNVEVVEGLVVGPAGLAIPVAGIEAGGLQDTFTQARAGDRYGEPGRADDQPLDDLDVRPAKRDAVP